ncbi:MAG: tyrosine-type recombinase/integrase [Candidatus Methylomirabilales bacterium]
MPDDAFDRLLTDPRVRDNPLSTHLASFASSLQEAGYAQATVKAKLGLLAEFGHWLGRRRGAVRDLEERRVARFVTHRERKGHLHRGARETLRQFLDHLRTRAVIPGPPPVRDAAPWATLLARYERHLGTERGLVTATVVNYLPYIRTFLAERFRARPFRVRAVNAADLAGFVLRHAPAMSPRRAQLMTTALRSFLRFLFREGALPTNLAEAVPTVADWRLSTIPKYLRPEEVARVLESCDRYTATGRRDHAILLLLARLGLRAGEVVALRLDDLDWRAGELLVRGKGSVHDRLPLPVEVGAALAAYLRDRPGCSTRRVLLRRKAPRREFAGPSTVSTIVRRALERAGLQPALKGAHLLRHSLATTLLRGGATLGEIGEVLRHRLPSTTELYAKVDVAGLRALAHPWPEAGGGQ